MSWSSYSVGNITPGEASVILRPKYPTTKRGVISVHGAGSGATHLLNTYGNQALQTKMIVDAGYTVISGDIGGDQWGNSTGLARMTAVYNYLQGVGVTPGKVALVSGSMGGLTSLNWAAANPTLVSCIVSCIPVINPNDIVVNNRTLAGTDYGPLVNTADGGYSEATMGSTYNPRTMAATTSKLRGIPMLLFYGTTDVLCVPTEIQAFAASTGMNVTLVPINSGHEESTYLSVDLDRVVAFITANN